MERIDGPTTDKPIPAEWLVEYRRLGWRPEQAPPRAHGNRRIQDAMEARKRAFERWCYTSGKVIAATNRLTE